MNENKLTREEAIVHVLPMEEEINRKVATQYIDMPRNDMNTPSKNPVKSRKISTRTPSSTPIFLKIPDVTVLF